MDNSVKITLIIVAGILLLVLVGFMIYSYSHPGNTVSVQGQSTVKAVPDLVSVYFNVESKADTAKEAKDANSEIVDNLIIGIVKLGFERADITTENFNVYPEYNYRSGNNEIIDYKAVHSIKVEMSTDRTDKIGDVIDAGVDAGAGISYINFELSQDKQNEYKTEALKQATEDARAKAEGIASGLGKRVGRLVSVSTSEFDYYPWRLYESGVNMDAEAAKAATTNIQPGEQDIYGKVSVSYKII